MTETKLRRDRRITRRVALTTALLFVLLTAIQLFVVYPAFIRLTVKDTQQEAQRDARHISHMLPHEWPLEVTPALSSEITMYMEDFHLWKLKLFAADGTVVYSTDAGEVGTVNEHDYFYQQVARGQVYSVTVWRKEVTMEGQVVPVDLVETYIPFMSGGQFLGACEIYYDVTERKAGVDRLVRQASMLTLGTSGIFLAVIGFLAARGERQEKESERLQEQLVRADRLAALGTLLGGVAHEFNNINVTVMGFSQLLLEDGDLGAESRSHVARIHRAARRAHIITNNLLDFSREGAGERERGNLAQVAREALDLVAAQYRKEGVTVRDRIEPVSDSAMNSDQMVQVALNLLSNSRHAMQGREEKVLTVETGEGAGKVYLRVQDTGCGIPEENMSQVFTPFFTTKGEFAETKEQSAVRGSGLGLSISHTIVTSHEGEITVESRVGTGTTFTVFLPAGGHGSGKGAAGDGIA